MDLGFLVLVLGQLNPQNQQPKFFNFGFGGC